MNNCFIIKCIRMVSGLDVLSKLALLMAFCVVPLSGLADPMRLTGDWYTVKSSIQSSDIPFLADPVSIDSLNASYPKSQQLKLTGGHYLYIAPIDIKKTGAYVLDFKNTSTIAKFRHQVFDMQHRRVFSVEGGIESHAYNPFFLRHGRDIELEKGRYLLVTEVISTSYLAVPEPYIDDRLHYQQAIKEGNVITLIGLGIFMGLGIYYVALAMSRSRWAEAMYAFFIFGNFVYNSAALLLCSDMLNVHSLRLVTMPILFSNIAYIIFVMHLLNIKKHAKPRMYWLGIGAIGLLLLFVLFAVAYPNWALELSRYGVILFLCYGLLTAISESIKKNPTAKRYLLAISVFFVLGIVSVSLSKLDNQFTIYIEHIGLVSVVIEVVILALVLAYQFSVLHTDRDLALAQLEVSVRTAYSDALTGLPNRHALVKDIIDLPMHASLTFIDLDGLKFYNDTYGHARGDDLLINFALSYQKCLDQGSKLYRLGGDEFAVINPKGEVEKVSTALDVALDDMKLNGFEFAGASLGSVYGHEAENIAVLMRMADMRMYENKRARKSKREREVHKQMALAL